MPAKSNNSTSSSGKSSRRTKTTKRKGKEDKNVPRKRITGKTPTGQRFDIDKGKDKAWMFGQGFDIDKGKDKPWEKASSRNSPKRSGELKDKKLNDANKSPRRRIQGKQPSGGEQKEVGDKHKASRRRLRGKQPSGGSTQKSSKRSNETKSKRWRAGVLNEAFRKGITPEELSQLPLEKLWHLPHN